MKNIVDFTRDHLQNNLDLAKRFSQHPTDTTRSVIEMLYSQAYGGVELLVAWLNYQCDPDNLVPTLLEMWNEEYRKEFEKLLQ